MKVVTFLALTTGASAQLAAYTAIGNSIAVQVKSLNSLIVAYTGGDGPGTAIIKQANVVLTAINSGASAAGKLQKLGDLTTALNLLPAFGTKSGLASDVQVVVKNLVAKKSVADANGLCSTAGVIISEELAAASQLEAVITSQLANLMGVDTIATAEVIGPINAALSSAVTAYNSCPPGSGSNPGSKPPGQTSTPSSSSSSQTSNPGNTPSSQTTTSAPPTCTSSAIGTKQIKKCLKIISQAALHPSGGYGEL